MLPRLREIDEYLDDAVLTVDRWVNYEEAKARIAQLVGFHAHESPIELQTPEAYDIALNHIVSRLEI